MVHQYVFTEEEEDAIVKKMKRKWNLKNKNLVIKKMIKTFKNEAEQNETDQTSNPTNPPIGLLNENTQLESINQ